MKILLPRLALSLTLMCSVAFAQTQEQEPQQQEASELTALVATAEGGDSAAQFELANRYLYGEGFIADEFEAARWFRLAAEQDNNNAQYNLAVMYMQGTGVIADNQTAVQWFRRAAELGDPPAQFTLATLYANGRIVAHDPVLAHAWFTLAASRGHRAAAANAVLYQEMLSEQQVADAQRVASEWVEKFNAQNKAADNPNAAQLRTP